MTGYEFILPVTAVITFEQGSFAELADAPDLGVVTSVNG